MPRQSPPVPRQAIRIGIVGYDGVGEISLIGPLQAFSNAFVPNGEDAALPCYEVVTISVTGEPFVAESGLIFQTRHGLDDAPSFDTIIIPGGEGLRATPVGKTIAKWVKTRAEQTRRIVAVCTGIYGLAPAGLLDGRRVTTHWRFARDVARRFPNLHVEENALYLRDGRFYTSAGGTAGIDLALSLVAQDFGSEVALGVARDLLVYLRRDGGQEQYAEPSPLEFERTDGMRELAHWIDRHLQEDLRLEKLAARVSLTKLHFIRQFKATFGETPAAFIKNRRLNEARRRLLRGENTASVAESVGFRSALYFSQEFKWRFGAAPEEYQSRFRVAPTGTAPARADVDEEVAVFAGQNPSLKGRRWDRRAARRIVSAAAQPAAEENGDELEFATGAGAGRHPARAAA